MEEKKVKWGDSLKWYDSNSIIEYCSIMGRKWDGWGEGDLGNSLTEVSFKFTEEKWFVYPKCIKYFTLKSTSVILRGGWMV